MDLVLGAAAFGWAARSTYALRGLTYRKDAPGFKRVLQVGYVYLLARLTTPQRGWPRVLVAALWLGWLQLLLNRHEETGAGYSLAFAKARFWRSLGSLLGFDMRLSDEWTATTACLGLTSRAAPRSVLALHPHAVFPFCGFLAGLTVAGGELRNLTTSGRAPLAASERTGDGIHCGVFPGMRLRAGAASFCFWIPGLRELFLRTGIIDVSEPFVRQLLQTGHDVAIFPGGAQESALVTDAALPPPYNKAPGAKPLRGRRRHVLLRRGVVRVALAERCNLIPLYTFGDEDVWQAGALSTPLWPLRTFLKEVSGILLPASLPGLRRVPCTSVLGVPIDFSDLWASQDVEVAAARYEQGLRQVFDVNKALVRGDFANDELFVHWQ